MNFHIYTTGIYRIAGNPASAEILSCEGVLVLVFSMDISSSLMGPEKELIAGLETEQLDCLDAENPRSRIKTAD